jgi:hypothetical protein
VKKLSPSELRKAHIRKTAVTLIRLKHSLKADEEINETLPDTLSEFDAALARGELLQLETAVHDILDDE